MTEHLVTCVGSVFIWRKSTHAIFLCAIAGGLGDFGWEDYFESNNVILPDQTSGY